MATLVLGALGTLVGGPLGGAIGALAGRQIDTGIIGSGSTEGPRLKELAVTTSSYGTPIPRHHGRMRTAGTIIWSTDLAENRENSGGSKGRPSTTTYSYSISFAVALSSRPIRNVGRIWADGNLLRGAAGDLKAGGSFRPYSGRGDQLPDPLIAAAEGDRCPAFRNCAYCVFEDLELGDFGNRVPALTFEIMADDGGVSLAELVQQIESNHRADMPLTSLEGFSYEGGALGATLTAIDALYPLISDSGGDLLTLAAADLTSAKPITLPGAASAWDANDFGGASGQNRSRRADHQDTPEAVRYYDVGRDFQPGIQRADGRARVGRTRTIDFPGAMSANDARKLANSASQRANWRRETLLWRITELDPAVAPGTVVRVPDVTGTWRVAGWEWREKGVELELIRLPPAAGTASGGDAGLASAPVDVVASPTILRAFELPWDGRGTSESPMMFAAASSAGGNWSGAALYHDIGGTLQTVGSTGRTRSVTGHLAAPLPPSEAIRLELQMSLEIEIEAEDLQFQSASVAELAGGANRLLVGDELIQFLVAEKAGPTRWLLRGLLRGRGGTEFAAQAGHVGGVKATLIDDRLVALDPAKVPRSQTTLISAIGRGDSAAVTVQLENSGVARRPLSPVHARVSKAADGSLQLRWTRRARGEWDWRSEVDHPLVEQAEVYTIGIGPVAAPAVIWNSETPGLLINPAQLAQLRADYPGAQIWVRQVGSYAQSDPLLLCTLGEATSAAD